MALRVLNIGGSANDGTGDRLRSAMDKIKNNFAELYSTVITSVTANKVFASPDNSTGVPTFRSLVLRDLPTTGASTSDVLTFNGSAIEWGDITTTILQAVYPVGSMYVNFANDTSPETVLGFGTWTRIEGRVIVGKSTTDTEFDTLLETGGAKTHTLSVAEMPAHTHSISNISVSPVQYGSSGSAPPYIPTGSTNTNSAGSSAAHNNLQPYIVASVWRRTA